MKLKRVALGSEAASIVLLSRFLDDIEKGVK